ncbi:MAG: O-antigen ligase family protein [Bryobacteraceae bacterium]|jgi:O-antigen ligase
MKSVLFHPAERTAVIAIALTAASVAVMPPLPRVCAVGVLVSLPIMAWMVSSSVAWIGLFLGAVLLLPPLPAAVGNSGAHPALLLAAFGVYAAFLFGHRWTFGKSPIVVTAAVLTALMLASVLAALIYSGAAIAVGSAVRVLLFAIGPFVFMYVVSGPGQTLAASELGPAKLLFAGGVLSALFACVDFYYQLPAPSGYSPQFIWLADRVLRRAQGLFYDAGALGNMCAFFLVMVAAALLAPGRYGLKRILAAVGAIPLATAMVFSYSRASVLNLVVSIGAMLFVRRQQVKWFRTAVAALAALTAVAVVVSSLAPGLTQWWVQRVQKTLELAFSASDAALSGRVSSWQMIASFTVEHPVRALLGVGYKTLPYSDVLGRPVIADNTYLSAFVETGIAGLAALCALHVAILRATYRAARSVNPTAAFYGLWAFSFWVGEIVQMGAADLLTYWRLLPVFFFVIGMAVLKAQERTA